MGFYLHFVPLCIIMQICIRISFQKCKKTNVPPTNGTTPLTRTSIKTGSLPPQQRERRKILSTTSPMKTFLIPFCYLDQITFTRNTPKVELLDETFVSPRSPSSIFATASNQVYMKSSTLHENLFKSIFPPIPTKKF